MADSGVGRLAACLSGGGVVVVVVAASFSLLRPRHLPNNKPIGQPTCVSSEGELTDSARRGRSGSGGNGTGAATTTTTQTGPLGTIK